MIYEVEIRGKQYKVELTRTADGIACRVDGREFPIEAHLGSDGSLSLLHGNDSYEFISTGSAAERQLHFRGTVVLAAVRDPRALRGRKAAGDEGAGPKKIIAPMPGKVVRVIAPEGTHVEAGAGVVVIEAMKMQNELKAPKAGIVKKLSVAEGAAVNAGDTLAVIE